MTAKKDKWPLPGDPNASVGARHHRVPKFYLERFGNERKRIATVDRRTGERRTAASRETAVEKDFYTAIDDEGEKDGKSEQLLTQIEGAAASAIRNITAPGLGLFPPKEQDRVEMCLFLAFQKVRGRRSRKMIELMGDMWARTQFPPNMSSDQASDLLRSRDLDVTPEAIASLVDLSAHIEDFQFVPDPNGHLSVMGDVALRLTEFLRHRPWYVVDFRAPVLLTSDEPVALNFKDGSRPPGYAQGLAYADEVWFPLDPRRLLILGRLGDSRPDQYVKLPIESAAEVNFAIAAGAYEEIYMHPDQDHLKGIQLPEPGPIFHVQADLPFDLSRYNRPVTDTKTQRRK